MLLFASSKDAERSSSTNADCEMLGDDDVAATWLVGTDDESRGVMALEVSWELELDNWRFSASRSLISRRHV